MVIEYEALCIESSLELIRQLQKTSLRLMTHKNKRIKSRNASHEQKRILTKDHINFIETWVSEINKNANIVT